ncbi:hypothetical protein WYO_2336 [Methylobacterium sp. GXF4]|uniref:hypothetical protein n=1 Tax=Methylobacterium sp. GXF4 TaxID=1096546 RepID=UPI000269A938|nr:hypothetical protein [Methylobacterium sp. GXF4]EIZ84963.1 hypothetical protein WYO_2336 [Methylobacterium sp. GXF4]
MPRRSPDLAEVAKKAANASFGSPLVQAVRLGDMEGSDGDDVRRVQLIVSDDAIQQLDGDKLLDAGLAISQALRKAGEPLRIVVEYAEQRELDELGAD